MPVNPIMLSPIKLRLPLIVMMMMLILLQENPERSWTVEKITEQLRSTMGSVKKRIDDLVARNVLSPDAVKSGGEIFYQPSSAEMRAAVDQAVLFYQQRQYTVMEFIFSKRMEGLQTFSDSFRFNKGDKE